MNVFTHLHHYIEHHKSGETPLVATVGFFDGVHLGHQRLISEVVEAARQLGGRSCIITFDAHPAKVLHSSASPPLVLSSTLTKLRRIAALGVDDVLLLSFTPELADVDAHAFISPLIEHARLALLLLGYDNRFGRRSDMSLDDYDRALCSWGVEVRRIAPVEADGLVVSSSRIRALVCESDFTSAERLLGHPYSFVGTVTAGARIGRAIGYPTANLQPIEPDIYLPSIGIYIAEARIGDQVFPAMAYYGKRPTVEQDGMPRIEVYLLDYSGDLYGQELEVGFREFIRSDQMFESIDALAAQLQSDEQKTRAYFATHSLTLTPPPSLTYLP